MKKSFFYLLILLFLIEIFQVNNKLYSEEINSLHLEFARKMISVIHATEKFDLFLPNISRELKNKLMRKNPNLEKKISKVVNDQVIKLISRRLDLEKEIAHIYAKRFTKDELQKIIDFYSSFTGKKFLKESISITSDSLGVYEIWRQGIAQDLEENVNNILDVHDKSKDNKNYKIKYKNK